MQQLDDLIAAISTALNKIGGLIVLPVMTVMMTADVILRYVFNAPLSWGLEASQHMLLLVFVFGMLEAFRTGAHIRMDLCYRVFGPNTRRAVTLLYTGAIIAVFVLLITKGWHEAVFMKSIGEVTQYIHMPIWLFYSVIIIVSGLIIIFFTVRVLAVLRGQREEIEDSHNPFVEAE